MPYNIIGVKGMNPNPEKSLDEAAQKMAAILQEADSQGDELVSHSMMESGMQMLGKNPDDPEGEPVPVIMCCTTILLVMKKNPRKVIAATGGSVKDIIKGIKAN